MLAIRWKKEFFKQNMCITLTYFTFLPEGCSMFREKLCLDFSVHSEDVDTKTEMSNATNIKHYNR